MQKRVRVVSPITTRGFRKPNEFEALQAPDVVIDTVEIDTGPASIECEFDASLAVPGTVAKIVEAERAGIHAVIIDCMGDPGLRPARECVSIPVVGPAETAMHIASMLGHRFSVLTVLDSIRPMLENQAKVYGVPEKLASVRSVDIPVLELESDLDRVKRELTDQGILAVERDGADVLILGCTGMLGCADAVRAGLLSKGHDVPVIDPVPTAVRFAVALVDAGLSHSKRTYQEPRAKPIVGYPDLDPSVKEAAE